MLRFPLTTAALTAGLGLVLAAAGILTLFATNVANQAVPVGAIVLLVLAALVFARVWVWSPVLGVLFCLFIGVGGFIAPPGFVYRLTHPEETSAFIGTTIQVIGMIVAIVAGIAVAMENSKRRAVGRV